MKIETYTLLDDYNTNAYLVWDSQTREAILIDPADDCRDILVFIEDNELKLKYIVNTHGHGDHIGGNTFFKEATAAKICVHKNDAEMLTDPILNLSSFMGNNIKSAQAEICLTDGEVIKLGSKELKIIHTPGHTKGGISIYTDGILFSGDTLFAASVGRTDLPGGCQKTIINSIKQKLFVLPGNTKVYPGHGDFTTIEDEKLTNPFVGELKGFI